MTATTMPQKARTGTTNRDGAEAGPGAGIAGGMLLQTGCESGSRVGAQLFTPWVNDCTPRGERLCTPMLRLPRQAVVPAGPSARQ
ncbi:hypothetical protein Slala03_40160 [Streptomyces lavendulae subsp. lavendulae]|nr:hypothetical protein Slala03_40160 [Streptomyces lavendulae subsp. lavendulae]